MGRSLIKSYGTKHKDFYNNLPFQEGEIMKIALICPSNILYMPYVSNYKNILNQNNVNCSVINWDRLQIENMDREYKYKDKKIGHQRNYFDYLKYKHFIIKILNEKKYDKLIVFGFQLSHFLKKYLIKMYEGKYVIDIRDFNKVLKYSNPKKLIVCSSFTVISSPGYKKWLPESDKYVINHNTQMDSLEELRDIDIKTDKQEINISNVGATRDSEVNIELINALSNNESINIYYHGEGLANRDINNHIKKNKIKNVLLTGRYNKENEEALYMKSNLINVLKQNNGINDANSLPNRLYNAVQYGKPMIALKGTYLAEQIKKYKLGLILSSFDDIEEKINRYLEEFSEIEYNEGRCLFFKRILIDNQYFAEKLKEFSRS